MTPTQVVESIYDAIQRRDLGFVLGQLDPDVVWQGPSTIPWGGKHIGPEGVKDFFVKLSENVELRSLTLNESIASGDRVVTLGSYEGRSPKTGKSAITDYCWVWRVKDGKISSYQGLFDTALVLAALN